MRHFMGQLVDRPFLHQVASATSDAAERRGWVTSSEPGPDGRRYYKVTEAGRDAWLKPVRRKA